MLEQLKLVDGTVTDDSDAFAFGGRAVYKNIFNERKYVEAYLLPDAEKVSLFYSVPRRQTRMYGLLVRVPPKPTPFLVFVSHGVFWGIVRMPL